METINTSGRRKTAVARVYLTPGKGEIVVNKRDYKEYFPSPSQQYKVNQPFELCNLAGQYDVKATLSGGGMTGQVEALRLAISKAIVENDPEQKPALRAEGLMTRDNRMVERKKPGQKKARKKFQFSKR
ncbi:MAG: 30S ribosomal protein S9 [Flavobacteriales bacterium]|nr:30S ribosomal protein S9 [Bacteroidota bacterium]MCB9240970.1 30S ribosomal protein S9 [Flavobacteriales bacterium]